MLFIYLFALCIFRLTASAMILSHQPSQIIPEGFKQLCVLQVEPLNKVSAMHPIECSLQRIVLERHLLIFTWVLLTVLVISDLLPQGNCFLKFSYCLNYCTIFTLYSQTLLLFQLIFLLMFTDYMIIIHSNCLVVLIALKLVLILGKKTAF